MWCPLVPAASLFVRGTAAAQMQLGSAAHCPTARKGLKVVWRWNLQRQAPKFCDDASAENHGRAALRTCTTACAFFMFSMRAPMLANGLPPPPSCVHYGGQMSNGGRPKGPSASSAAP